MKQGGSDGDVKPGGGIDIFSDVNGLDLPMVFNHKIGQDSGLFHTKAAARTNKKDMQMSLYENIRRQVEIFMIGIQDCTTAGEQQATTLTRYFVEQFHYKPMSV